MPAFSSRRSAHQVTGDDLLVETAWLYYEDRLNQTEIAARLDVSRATVVNYLQEARERGYVQVRLAAETFTGHRLARALGDRFALAAAFVLPDGAGPAATAARVVRGAADWLPHLLSPGDRLGVAWGKTIYDVAEALEPRPIPDLTVLQLVGSMATPYGFSADVCSSTVARKLSARCINLHVPAVLSDARTAALLRRGGTLHQIALCRRFLRARKPCRLLRGGHTAGPRLVSRPRRNGRALRPLHRRCRRLDPWPARCAHDGG